MKIKTLAAILSQLYGSTPWEPSALFASSEVGVWYDPSDLTSMFQDSAGTTAVTAVGQPVGLLLDKSQGLVLGPELVTNGTFDTDSAWTISDAGAVLFSNGVVRFNTSALYARFYQSYAYTVGKTYELRFDVVARVSSSVEFRTNNAVARNIQATAVGSYVFRFQAVSGDNVIQLGNADAASDITIDNLSIKELPGNHATQATAASRPVLRESGGLYYLEFDGTDDYLVSSAIDFSATDEMSVFFGHQRDTDFLGIPFELSTVVTNSGSFALYAGYISTVNGAGWTILGKGSSLSSAASAGSWPAPVLSVMTALIDISTDTLTLDHNGSQIAASSSDLGTGNFGNYVLYIGRRAGTSSPFNGNIYSLIVRGALSDVTEIDNAEAYVNGKTGAY